MYTHVPLHRHVTHHLLGCHWALSLSVLDMAAAVKRYNERPETFSPASSLEIGQNQYCVVRKLLSSFEKRQLCDSLEIYSKCVKWCVYVCGSDVSSVCVTVGTVHHGGRDTLGCRLLLSPFLRQGLLVVACCVYQAYESLGIS